MCAVQIPFLSPKQYLEIEQKAEFKSEYWNGQMHALPRATPRHTEAAALFMAAAIPRLKRKGCGVFSSDLRIRDSENGLYTYPDISIICGKPEYGESLTLANPTVLIEVLSASTELKDRGFKLERYQHIESLQEYVLVSQEKPRVETYYRQADRAWRYQSFDGLTASLLLQSVGIEIPLTELYDGITFRDWFAATPVPGA
jgi:Uma2 family endonuclease